MKKISVILFVVSAVVVFSYCSSTKNAASAPKVPAKINFQANVMAIIQANCAPCHIPDKGGRKKALDTYASASANIDDILRRIQLEPNARGFMPDKKPAKLSEADINTFKQWKADGLLAN